MLLVGKGRWERKDGKGKLNSLGTSRVDANGGAAAKKNSGYGPPTTHPDRFVDDHSPIVSNGDDTRKTGSR